MLSSELRVIVLACLSSALAAASTQPTADIPMVTVCDLAKSPSIYAGKMVRFRARAWSDYKNIWIHESSAGTGHIRSTCGWMPAIFVHGSRFVGVTGFATFVGRLEYVPTADFRRSLAITIESESDIHDLRVLNGAIPARPPGIP
jgi:hypothetical protein